MYKPVDWTVGIPASTLIASGTQVSGYFPLDGASARAVLYRMDGSNITSYIIYDDNGRAIKRVMNHQHIDDLLPGTDKVGIDNLFYLGQSIKQMWENRLKSLYRDRRFEVCCNRDEYTVVVTFYQIGTSS